jgi:methylglutaconyl-CoA hydratase
MPDGSIVREDQGLVTLLKLARPRRRNALSRALVAELSDALSAIASDSAIRAVVLTGEGSTFCSGMDLKEAETAHRSTDSESRSIADVQAIADVIQQLHTLSKPTIAALNGDALAGGAGLAAACDFIVASRSAKIAYPEVKRGLVAAVVMHDLIRQAGERRARELLISGEPIDAETAERWGLVNRVVDPETCLDEALDLARSLASCGPLAIGTTKRLIDEATGRPPDLRGAAAISAAVRVSEEALEGMRAFLAKREPRWASGSR